MLILSNASNIKWLHFVITFFLFHFLTSLSKLSLPPFNFIGSHKIQCEVKIQMSHVHDRNHEFPPLSCINSLFYPLDACLLGTSLVSNTVLSTLDTEYVCGMSYFSDSSLGGSAKHIALIFPCRYFTLPQFFYFYWSLRHLLKMAALWSCFFEFCSLVTVSCS